MYFIYLFIFMFHRSFGVNPI